MDSLENRPDAVFFGNYIGGMHACDEVKGSEDWETCARFARSSLPECRGKGQLDPYMCSTWKGRRKHIDRVSSVSLTKVHKVSEWKHHEPILSFICSSKAMQNIKNILHGFWAKLFIPSKSHWKSVSALLEQSQILECRGGGSVCRETNLDAREVCRWYSHFVWCLIYIYTYTLRLTLILILWLMIYIHQVWLDHYRGQPYNFTSPQCLCEWYVRGY